MQNMNIPLIVVILLIIPFVTTAQSKTDLELEDIKGAVHTIHDKTFFENSAGKTVKKGVQSENIEIYDRTGNKTESQGVLGLGGKQKSTFSRDSKGNRIEKIANDSTFSNVEGPPPPATGSSSAADFLELKTVFKFNAAANQLEAVLYRKNGEIIHTKIYQFNEKGKVVEFSQKDGPTIPFGSQYKIRYERDNEGTVTKSITYMANGKIERQTMYKYEFDKQGNWLKQEETLFDGNGNPTGDKFITIRAISYY
jgi:hypothetical protein